MPANAGPASDDRRFPVAERPKLSSHQGELVIGALAERQHGVVARRQLVSAGVTPAMLKARIATGHLVRLHRGVYGVGHTRLGREGKWLAAVLAAGPGALLSHRDAATLHGLLPACEGRIDVTSPARAASTRAIRVHRTTVLTPRDAAVVEGVPVTSVARTLVDLAGTVRRHLLVKALDEAERTRQLDERLVHEALRRTQTRHGAGHRLLTAALADLAAKGTQLTRSELEDRFVALVDAGELPRPLMNTMRHGYEVDAYWPAADLAVELDGYAYHHTRAAIQRDRDKDNELELAGVRLLRFTHDDVVRRPARTASRIRRALALRTRAQPPAGGMSR